MSKESLRVRTNKIKSSAENQKQVVTPVEKTATTRLWAQKDSIKKMDVVIDLLRKRSGKWTTSVQH